MLRKGKTVCGRAAQSGPVCIRQGWKKKQPKRPDAFCARALCCVQLRKTAQVRRARGRTGRWLCAVGRAAAMRRCGLGSGVRAPLLFKRAEGRAARLEPPACTLALAFVRRRSPPTHARRRSCAAGAAASRAERAAPAVSAGVHGGRSASPAVITPADSRLSFSERAEAHFAYRALHCPPRGFSGGQTGARHGAVRAAFPAGRPARGTELFAQLLR